MWVKSPPGFASLKKVGRECIEFTGGQGKSELATFGGAIPNLSKAGSVKKYWKEVEATS